MKWSKKCVLEKYCREILVFGKSIWKSLDIAKTAEDVMSSDAEESQGTRLAIPKNVGSEFENF